MLLGNSLIVSSTQEETVEREPEIPTVAEVHQSWFSQFSREPVSTTAMRLASKVPRKKFFNLGFKVRARRKRVRAPRGPKAQERIIC